MVASALTINWHGSTAERNDRRPFKLVRGTAEVSSPYHTLTIDEAFNLFLTNAQVEELRTLLNLYHGDDKDRPTERGEYIPLGTKEIATP